jgi:uncharacterized membrane protein (UPF0127 family)
VRFGLLVALSLSLLVTSCEGEDPCEEDVAAQVLEDRVELTIRASVFRAELADEATERDRGWKYRRCDREALVLLLEEPGFLPVWGCDLAYPVDVAFVREDEVVDSGRLEPCPSPCGSCLRLGEGVEVDFVVELPVDSVTLEVGMSATIELE